MTRKRILGLCLVAVFALGAMLASSAMAAPHFNTENTKTHVIEELKPGKLIAAKGTSVGTAKLEPLGIICTSYKSKGDIEGPNKTVKTFVEYKGCSDPNLPGKPKCNTAPKVKGEIKTLEVEGFLANASETVGGTEHIVTHYIPAKGGKNFTEFNCGGTEGLTVEVFGGILAEATPVEVLATSGKSINAEKVAEIPGCGKQQWLYENGTGGCIQLFTQGPTTSWNDAVTNVSYGTKKVEVHP